VDSANRWINCVPGACLVRLKDLKNGGDRDGYVDREKFMGHVRTTLAHLEKKQSRNRIGGAFIVRHTEGKARVDARSDRWPL